MRRFNSRFTRKKRRILPKYYFSRFALAFRIMSLLAATSLVLTACAGSMNAATPEKPIYPTAVATQTVEQPATQQAPTVEPTEIPTAEPTLSPAERNYEWTAEEAVTTKVDATEKEILAALKEIGAGHFPAVYTKEAGDYNFNCLVESISYLKEGHYVQIGDFDVRATAQCSYLDINDEKQTITVALVIENRVEGTNWTPRFGTEGGTYAPSFIQEFFEKTHDIKPGVVSIIDFGMPNITNQDPRTATAGSLHHGEAVPQFQSEEEMTQYIASGDPGNLNDPMILPFSIQLNPLYQPLHEN